jgi:hypothetical protein
MGRIPLFERNYSFADIDTPTADDEIYSAAYDEGTAAANDAADIRDNPYKPGTVKYNGWRKGWEEAPVFA